MKKLGLIPLLVLVALVACLAGQSAPQPATGSITGTVLNAVTLQPVPNVRITLDSGTGVTSAPANSAALSTIIGNVAVTAGADVTRLLNDLLVSQSGPPPTTVLTDQGGHFVVPNLSPGPYTVAAQLEGYFGPEFNGTSPSVVRASVVVTDTQPGNASFSLYPGGTVSGRVLDENGQPAINTTVQVLRIAYSNGARTVQLAGSRATDDRGNYRHYGLMPGEYFVGVIPQQAIGARGGRGGGAPGTPAVNPSQAASTNGQPLPVRTYFPNATDLPQASVLRLRAGEEISAININFRIASGARISGQVLSRIPASEMVFPAQSARGGIAGGPNATLSLYLHDRNAPQDPNSTSNLSISLGDPGNGRFDIPNVPPGLYDLYASVPDINGFGPAQPPGRAVQPVAYGRTTIDVHGGNLEGVNISVHHGVDIRGSVTIDGGTSPAINNVRISLQADDSASRVQVYQQIGRFQPMIEADGSFTIPAVSEAQYRIQVTFGPPQPQPPTAAQPTVLETLATGEVVGIRGARGAPPANENLSAVPLPAGSPAGPPLDVNAYVADIRQSGRSVYDDGITVGFQNIEPLEVLVKTDGGVVEGTVRGSNQTPAAGATVVLIPSAQRRQNTALYKTAVSDSSGHFSLRGIRPDEYKLLAWESIPPGAYLNRDVQKDYESQGITIIVPASIHLATQVPLIPAEH